MKISSLVFLAIMPFLIDESTGSGQKSVDSEMKQLWKTQIGCASFKTNVVINDREILIGSNGDNFYDYYPIDSKSGVYRIDGHNGKIVNRAGEADFGDMDVNGVLKYNNRLYFGNDNEEFLCTSINGKIIWSLATSGDIEHEPVIIQNKSVAQIIYATERGEVNAINPETGKSIWKYYTNDFSGWKQGKNRFAFKVGAYFSSTESFYTKPELADVNNDGTLDLVYQLYRREMIALDGSNGRLLWSKKMDYQNDFTTQIGSPSKPLFISTTYNYSQYPEIYGYIYLINRKGEIINTIKKRVSTRISAVNSTHIDRNQSVVSFSDSLYVFDENGNISKTIDYGALCDQYDSSNVKRNYSEVILGKNAFTYKGHKNCMIIMHQYAGNEGNARIDIVSIDEGMILDRLFLKGRSEMPPVVCDVNKDGKQDLLVNCFDGYLYAYALPTK